MSNLVPNDQVNHQSVLDNVFAFGVGDFVRHTKLHPIVWFVFHTVGTGHDVVSRNIRRTEVKQVQSFDVGWELISVGHPVIPVRFGEEIEAGFSKLSVQVIRPVCALRIRRRIGGNSGTEGGQNVPVLSQLLTCGGEEVEFAVPFSLPGLMASQRNSVGKTGTDNRLSVVVLVEVVFQTGVNVGKSVAQQGVLRKEEAVLRGDDRQVFGQGRTCLHGKQLNLSAPQ